MQGQPKLEDFPVHSFEKLRYRDVDRQGHVNNAVFVTYLETARIDLLSAAMPGFWQQTEYGLSVARLELDYRAELLWPGTVEAGGAVLSIGNSSVRIVQAMFQNGKLAAEAQTVLVLVDGKTHRPVPLPADARARLTALMRPSA